MRKRLLRVLWIVLGLYLIPIGFYAVYAVSSQHSEGKITYLLEWATEGASKSPEGWLLTNDLAYRVTLEQGYLSTIGVQLSECEHSHGFLAWLQNLLTVAFAGHGGELNAAALGDSMVESLSNLKSITMGEVSVLEPRYCSAHYLAAKAYESTRYLPSEVAMQGLSLWLKGSYQKLGEAPQDFFIQTDMAFGKIHELLNSKGQPSKARLTKAGLRVSFERQLASLFDGVDFEAMTESGQARTILRNLTHSTRVLVR